MSPRAAAILRWSLLALLGLVVAVAVGVAAASITSSRIGISNEPVRAGEALAPKAAKRDDHRGGRGRDHPEDGRHHGGGSDDSTTTTTTSPPATTTTTPPVTTTAPPPTTTTPTTTSDDSGHSEDGDDD
ncbi:MAG: hypothetical protein R2718_13650 [Solirubrobacterales bacterium]